MSADFMRRAIALAQENIRSGRGGPFGAVIVKRVDERTRAKTSINELLRD